MNEQEAFPIWFVTLWCVGFVFSLYAQVYLDRWRWLAKRYRVSQPASGKKWRFQRVTIGWLYRYNFATLTANVDGLFMEPFWLWRFWYPRLFIPWQDFHKATVKDYILARTLEVQVGNPRIATLRLSPDIFERSEGRSVLEAEGIGTNVPN